MLEKITDEDRKTMSEHSDKLMNMMNKIIIEYTKDTRVRELGLISVSILDAHIRGIRVCILKVLDNISDKKDAHEILEQFEVMINHMINNVKETVNAKRS